MARGKDKRAKRSKRRGHNDMYTVVDNEDSMSAMPSRNDPEDVDTEPLFVSDGNALANTSTALPMVTESGEAGPVSRTTTTTTTTTTTSTTAPRSAQMSASPMASTAATTSVPDDRALEAEAVLMAALESHLAGPSSATDTAAGSGERNTSERSKKKEAARREKERLKQERREAKKKKKKERARANESRDGRGSRDGGSSAGAAGSETTTTQPPPSSGSGNKHVPVNPVSHQFLVQNPDGELCVAVDVLKPATTVEPAQPGIAEDTMPAPSTFLAHRYQAQVLSDIEEMQGALTYETLLHMRRLRSFIFLLGMDFFYLLLLLVMRVAGQRDEHTQYQHFLSLVFNLVLDGIGFSGAYRQNVNHLTLFIVCGGIFVAFEGIVQTFSPMIIVRLVIIVLAMQIRQGLILLRQRQIAALELLAAHTAIQEGQQPRPPRRRGRNEGAEMLV